ncbi:signal transduction histidine kinase [Phyllosticta capitalensis]
MSPWRHSRRRWSTLVGDASTRQPGKQRASKHLMAVKSREHDLRYCTAAPHRINNPLSGRVSVQTPPELQSTSSSPAPAAPSTLSTEHCPLPAFPQDHKISLLQPFRSLQIHTSARCAVLHSFAPHPSPVASPTLITYLPFSSANLPCAPLPAPTPSPATRRPLHHPNSTKNPASPVSSLPETSADLTLPPNAVPIAAPPRDCYPHKGPANHTHFAPSHLPLPSTTYIIDMARATDHPEDKSEDGSTGLPEAGDAIDTATFEQILEMDDDEEAREFSKSIVFDFFQQADSTFEKMETSLKEKDLAQLSQLGHFLKGSSATLGLTKVKDSCEKIQHFGANKDETGTHNEPDDKVCLERLTKTIAQAKQEFKDVEKVLRKFYKSNDDETS